MKKTPDSITPHQQKPGQSTDKAEGESARAREDRRDADRIAPMGRAAPCGHQSQRASTHARLWYGMPAYYPGRQRHLLLPEQREVQDEVMTLGFSDKANLDEGAMWPTSFALKELTAPKR